MATIVITWKFREVKPGGKTMREVSPGAGIHAVG
jgi:hypothetical protein